MLELVLLPSISKRVHLRITDPYIFVECQWEGLFPIIDISFSETQLAMNYERAAMIDVVVRSRKLA